MLGTFHTNMDQPIPSVTGADVERVVRRDFPPDQFGAVMSVLSGYGGEVWQQGECRVRMAALKLAAGSLEGLHQEIEKAKRDYRDVLAHAEYPAYTKQVFSASGLSADEQRKIMDEDWRQYETWLKAGTLSLDGKAARNPMDIREFPLAWRWTDELYSVFSDEVLSQIQPLSRQDAQFAFETVRGIQRNSGVILSVGVSDEDGRIWLRERHDGLDDLVNISWSPDCALRTSWRIFTEHWSDFCYPSSDDVVVCPDSADWVLSYHHDERFEFTRRLGN